MASNRLSIAEVHEAARRPRKNMVRRMIADIAPVIDSKSYSIGTSWQPFLFHGGEA
jgi:hypothetical protein